MTRLVVPLAVVIVMAALVAAGLYWPKGAVPEAAGIPAEVLTNSAASPVLGPAEAPVTITAFFDPSRQADAASYLTIKELLAKYPQDVRVVLRYAPREGFDKVVAVLEAARLQDKFVRVWEALLGNRLAWAVLGAADIDRAWILAEEVGLDVARGRQDAQRPEVAALLAEDMADAQRADIAQTPTFFINGKPLPAPDAQQLSEQVAAEVLRTRRP